MRVLHAMPHKNVHHPFCFTFCHIKTTNFSLVFLTTTNLNSLVGIFFYSAPLVYGCNIKQFEKGCANICTYKKKDKKVTLTWEKATKLTFVINPQFSSVQYVNILLQNRTEYYLNCPTVGKSLCICLYIYLVFPYFGMWNQTKQQTWEGWMRNTEVPWCHTDYSADWKLPEML